MEAGFAGLTHHSRWTEPWAPVPGLKHLPGAELPRAAPWLPQPQGDPGTHDCIRSCPCSKKREMELAQGRTACPLMGKNFTKHMGGEDITR